MTQCEFNFTCSFERNDCYHNYNIHYHVPLCLVEFVSQIILLSWKPSASIFKPWTWILDARPSRFFKLLK